MIPSSSSDPGSRIAIGTTAKATGKADAAGRSANTVITTRVSPILVRMMSSMARLEPACAKLRKREAKSAAARKIHNHKDFSSGLHKVDIRLTADHANKRNLAAGFFLLVYPGRGGRFSGWLKIPRLSRDSREAGDPGGSHESGRIPARPSSTTSPDVVSMRIE